MVNAPCCRSLVRPSGMLAALMASMAIAGCATPVGVTKVDMAAAYQEINANALLGSELSSDTRIILHRFNLLEQFEQDPAGVISRLHKAAATDRRRDHRFALSELSYYHAERIEASKRQENLFDPWETPVFAQGLAGYAPDYYLMSALYAYSYLLGPAPEEPPAAYDRRFRVACDLYNRSLAKAFATGRDGQLEFEDRVRRLPVATLTITVKKKSALWSPDGSPDRTHDGSLNEFKEFQPADSYRVKGLSLRDRTPGLGLPLIAVLKKTPRLPGEPAMPVTAFLRITGDDKEKEWDSLQGVLEFYSAFDEAVVTVGSQKVPLETDATAPVAYKLNDPSVWSQLGIKRFFTPRSEKTELVRAQPYQRGLIPVVFVHGTASNPLWWAEMVNTLRSDPVLKKRCQFWLFIYNSSAPVLLSAAELREKLSGEVRMLDPDGSDPSLRTIVVIGHSQGGLLTKALVVHPGDRLWRSLTDKDIDQLDVTPEIRRLLERTLRFDPLPSVKRVVFISTPHRGSYRVSGWVQTLMRKLINLPSDIYYSTKDIMSLTGEQLKLPSEMRGKIPTSVDSMSSDNPVLIALADLPVAPGVKAHSIIAVQGEGDYRSGNDGVVDYGSAHLDGVESEFIVRSGHSCQDNPLTIEEVRRILLEHLAANTGDSQGP